MPLPIRIEPFHISTFPLAATGWVIPDGARGASIRTVAVRLPPAKAWSRKPLRKTFSKAVKPRIVRNSMRPPPLWETRTPLTLRTASWSWIAFWSSSTSRVITWIDCGVSMIGVSVFVAVPERGAM